MWLFLYRHANTLPFFFGWNKRADLPQNAFDRQISKSLLVKWVVAQGDNDTQSRRIQKRESTKEKKLFRNKSFNARVLITFCSSPLQHIDQNLLTRQHISLADGKSKRAKAREMVFGEFLHTKNCFHFYHKLMNQLWVKLSCCSRF